MENHVMAGSECLEFQLARGSSVRCLEGVLWLTFEPAQRGDPSLDWMLVAGQLRVMEAPGRLFVSRGCMTPRAILAIERAPVPGLLARLRAWCAGRAAAAPQAAARAP